MRYALLTLLWFPILAMAQDDDMFGELDKMTAEQQQITTATFKANRIVNSPSVELTKKGDLNFLVQHRFGTINNGLYDLFGIDNSEVRLAFDYGITDFLMVGIGRSGGIKTYDANIKAQVLQQQTGQKNIPVTVALYGALAYDFTEQIALELDGTNRTSYVSQVLIARKFSESLSVQLAPTYVHKNLVDSAAFSNSTVALGLGFRQKVSKRVSINGDYVYRFEDAVPGNTFNSVALGVDIETGGHVFSLHITNSRGMVERSYITETTGDIADGDIYFGFNINRAFTLKKQDPAEDF